MIGSRSVGYKVATLPVINTANYYFSVYFKVHCFLEIIGAGFVIVSPRPLTQSSNTIDDTLAFFLVKTWLKNTTTLEFTPTSTCENTQPTDKGLTALATQAGLAQSTGRLTVSKPAMIRMT